jgi:Flp pilus assembly protein TadG
MICGFQRERAHHRTQIRFASKCKERGSSLLEQSFILVFLLTMMFGIIDCGRALYTYHFVSNVAREASRWASVRSQGCDRSALSDCPVTPSGDNLQTVFTANLSSMGLDSTKLTFTTSWVVPPGVGAASCPAPDNLVGCMVHVDVAYNYTFFFASFIAAPPIRMASSSEMLITQ